MTRMAIKRAQMARHGEAKLEIVSCGRTEDAKLSVKMRDIFCTWPYQLSIRWLEDARVVKSRVLNLVTPHLDGYLRSALGLWYPEELPSDTAVKTRLTQNACNVEFLLGDFDKATDEFLVRPEVSAEHVLVRIEGYAETDPGEEFLGYSPIEATAIYTSMGWMTYMIMSLSVVNWPAEVPMVDGKYYADNYLRLIAISNQLRDALRDFVRCWN